MSTRNPRYDERVASEDSENVPIVSGQKIGDKENQSLLGNDPKYSTEDLYRNFFVMSAAFAVNHGCVVACLAYASTELGNEMGSVGSGILYVCYAVTAFFVSKPLVTTLGPKLGLFAGVFGYFIYVLGFCIAVASKYIFVDAAWLVSSISAAIGGIAGGLLWTAQGRYFSRHAKLYSESSGIPVEKVNATFAGVFATMFLGLEMCTKLLGTVIFLMVPAGASFLVFSLYTAASLVACVFVAGLDDLDDKPTWDFSYQTVSYHAGAAARLVWLDGRMALIVPFQLAFGFCSSFVPYYVFGTVIAGSDSLGSSYVGLLSALIVLTGASMAIPSAWAANKFGKPLVMTVGGLCLAYTGFAFFIFSDAQLGTWAAIVPLLIIYGIGRGTWENTNKAVIADMWNDTGASDHCTTAFAAATFFNGYASAMGYFTFPDFSRLGMAGTVMMSALIGLVAYYFAFRLNESQRQAPPEEDKKAALRRQYWEYRGKKLPPQKTKEGIADF